MTTTSRQIQHNSMQYSQNSDDKNNFRYGHRPIRHHFHQRRSSLNSQHRSCESINMITVAPSSPIRIPQIVSDHFIEVHSLSKSITRSSFYSMWNILKYEFNHRFRNKFNFDSPICLLGQLYHSKMSDSINLSDEQSLNLYVYDKFKKDYFSRIWLTYRKDFPPLLNTNITTDNGWGCMIRSGQMILAQAFLSHFHGRNWRWEGQDDLIHRMIVKWFADIPDKSISPFSIHEIVRMGQKFGKNPGDWFGPASVSFIIKHLLVEASKENSLLYDICCYIAQDCTVYLQDVLDLCTGQQNPHHHFSTMKWRSIIILIPVRLGGDQFNKIYASYLKQILSIPSCLGVIGGKPRHSLYFVGFQDDKLLAIDPHYCQKSIDVRFKANFPLESFHCSSPQRVPLHSIDPSCTIGFYLKNKEDYDEFIILINQMLDYSYKIGKYPIFSLDENKFEYCKNQVPPSRDEILRMEYRLVDSRGNVKKVCSEDFVLL